MFQKLRKKLKGRSGQSLAEFAVTNSDDGDTCYYCRT